MAEIYIITVHIKYKLNYYIKYPSLIRRITLVSSNLFQDPKTVQLIMSRFLSQEIYVYKLSLLFALEDLLNNTINIKHRTRTYFVSN